jgi:mannose-6-phosphate isomerase-like protein (cupin superfamily)
MAAKPANSIEAVMSDFTFAPGTNEFTKNHFTAEAEALAEIAAMGWTPLVRDVVIPRDEALHWHDFESVTFVVSGTIRVADEHGEIVEVAAGTRVRSGPGFLHRELGGSAYRVVSGFRTKLDQFTLPIDKPPPTK